MSELDVERLRQIKTLPSLIKFLRDELDWPVETDDIEDLTFDYSPEELGLDPKHAAKIKEIKQLRPLDSRQPWGIFWVNFEKKQLPMVVLRRILGNLVIKRRASTRKVDRRSWHLHDLLFISAYGEEEHRTISFAHFLEDPETDELPVLRVLGWDDQNSHMHVDRVLNRLHSHFRWPGDSEDVDAWRKLWSEAFTDRYREAIRSADELIPRLANLASGVRQRVRDVLDAETERGPMRRLFDAVQKLLIHDMAEDGFADMYAQTVAYGLLSARFSRPAGLTAQNLVQLTAISNPFLENLLENLFRLNRGKFQFDVDEVGINDVLDLLRNTNIEAIKAAFSDKNPAEDPVIRFYEGFLKQYDPRQRIKRGVFFTPRPVVSYIVRSVHELLQTEFGLEDGLASTTTWAEMKNRFPELTIPKGAKPEDPFVCILDPATGTGTFLFECIEVIERTMKDKWCQELGRKDWSDPEIHKRWRKYVRNHLLPRLYGYELMMAPYSIAHLKLALKLGETGYQFQEGDRLHIYLTNSLEIKPSMADPRLADMFTTLATEAQEVNTIKQEKRFTIVIGNPPYAGESANKTLWIHDLVNSRYQYINGIKVEEKGKKNWLLDDYVKFIRFSHFISEHSPYALIGLITNHSYLDNPTFRGMRHALMSDFFKIFFLDLHGNYKKREICPNGSKDDNVFDIQQGVCIGLFIKNCSTGSASNNQSTIFTSDIWGARETKYSILSQNSYSSIEFAQLLPDRKFFFFKDVGINYAEYEEWWPLNKIFQVNGNGVITAHDHFSIAFNDEELSQRLDLYLNPRLKDEQVLEELNLRENSMWKIRESRQALRESREKNLFVDVLYRPFDIRRTFFHKSVVFNLRLPVMKHLLLGDNLALICSRMTKGENFAHVFVSRTISEAILLSSKTSNNAFSLPLLLYDNVEHKDLFFDIARRYRTNFTPEFINSLPARISSINSNDDENNSRNTNIFNYIYAILHSHYYRNRYGDLLRRDFPSIPSTKNLMLFQRLADIGSKLVMSHLLESPKLDHPITTMTGKCNYKVERVSYSDQSVWLDKAKTVGFNGVPEEIWHFHIGGYQVCEKWLKYRKGRQLSTADITHYQKIIVALTETIRLMAKIDEVIDAHGGWPGAFMDKKSTSS
ncbi:type ISP restriction/modification enzyme [candidate division KSB1 bacterium]